MINKLFILKLLTILTLLSTLAFSAELNVINENPNAKIFVDGKLSGTGSVYKLEVNQGEHHVKVIIDNAIIYSEIINVEEGSTRTINTTRFVSAQTSDIADISAENIEKKRVKKSKGNIAVGFQVGSEIHGISLKGYFTDKLGAQILYFTREESGSISDYSTIHGRLIYNLKERLSSKGRIRSFYTGIGYGSKKEAFASDRRTDDQGQLVNNPFKDKDSTAFELFIGVEIPTGPFTYFNAEASYVNLDGKQKEFGDDATSTNYSNSDLRLSAGFHYYF